MAIFVVELEEHIHLLRHSVPGWLEIHYIRKTNYLKLSKNADMGPVIKKLEALAAEKNDGWIWFKVSATMLFVLRHEYLICIWNKTAKHSFNFWKNLCSRLSCQMKKLLWSDNTLTPPLTKGIRSFRVIY